MLYYRFYLEDAAGRIVRAQEATMPGDAEALHAARAIGYPYTVSVWQQARCVADIAPTRADGGPSAL